MTATDLVIAGGRLILDIVGLGMAVISTAEIPIAVVAYVASAKGASIRAAPRPWVIQLLPLVFLPIIFWMGKSNACDIDVGPQPRCPGALDQLAPIVRSVYAAQVSLGALLALWSSHRVFWLLMQSLFAVQGYVELIFSYLMVTGSWI